MSKLRPTRTKVPAPVVELLRMCFVVFGAALGYQVSGWFELHSLGALNPITLGVVVGSGLGYVVGGVLSRRTVVAVTRTEASLRAMSAEQLIAGVLGAGIGVVLGAAIAWPVFLIGQLGLALPVFVFCVANLALLGYRVGVGRRDLLSGLSPRPGSKRSSARPTAVLPRLVDSSVAIDGRIIEVVRAGFLSGRMIVCQPILDELQGLADAGDELRRSKGRRGLDVLEALRRERAVHVELVEDTVPQVPEVDAKLVRLALDNEWALLTLDTNLARSASLAGVNVLNLHALTLALRPPVVAGDEVSVLLTKPGKEPGQAIGYLDDGTMVVVERARDGVGQDALVLVTSVLTTGNGRMVFARPISVAGQPVGDRA